MHYGPIVLTINKKLNETCIGIKMFFLNSSNFHKNNIKL